MRFCSVPFGIISSPFILLATIRYHLAQRNSQLALELKHNTYADNTMLGAVTTEEALVKAKNAKTEFAAANMNLREFFSNDMEVYQQYGDDPTVLETKFLGLKWHVSEDVVTIKFPTRVNETPTKRRILKYLAKLYDPLWFASPATLWPKLFLQSLWQRNISWDEELDSNDVQE